MARARVYRLTPARKRALHKAQLASARKRSRNKKIVKGVLATTAVAGGLALTGRAAYVRHKLSGSTFTGPSAVRTPTATMELVGVKLNVFKDGFTHRNLGADGHRITYDHRNKQGDRRLLTYHHRKMGPITMDAVKATFGAKIKGAPQQVTQHKPHQAIQNPADVTFIDINHGLIDHVSKKKHESTAKLHGRLVRFGPEGAKKSPAIRNALKRRIGDVSLIEVLERTRHYKAAMAKNGITISREHERLVSQILGNRRT